VIRCRHANTAAERPLTDINISDMLIDFASETRHRERRQLLTRRGNKWRRAPSHVAFLRNLYASIGDMSPVQCLRARTLLNWTPADLARAAGVSVITVRNFEAGKVATGRLAPVLMKRAFEGAGIRFSAAGEGVEGSVRLAPGTREK